MQPFFREKEAFPPALFFPIPIFYGHRSVTEFPPQGYCVCPDRMLYRAHNSSKRFDQRMGSFHDKLSALLSPADQQKSPPEVFRLQGRFSLQARPISSFTFYRRIRWIEPSFYCSTFFLRFSRSSAFGCDRARSKFSIRESRSAMRIGCSFIFT